MFPYNAPVSGDVVELVDTRHSKCRAFGRDGSTPSIATIQIFNKFPLYWLRPPFFELIHDFAYFIKHMPAWADY